MDFLRGFIMTGIRDMIAKDMALYQTYQYASGWFSKGVLLQEDLEEIDKLYKDKEQVIEETTTEEIIENSAEEVIVSVENAAEETGESAEINNEETVVAENETTEATEVAEGE